MCVFCDASIKSIGAVAYLKVTNAEGQSEVEFILGKAKFAPKPDLTIPRLELGTAVLAVKIAVAILEELDTELDDSSLIARWFLANKLRRFYIYVHNQVQ